MLIPDFPLMSDNVIVAKKVYGPNLHSLKLKIVRKHMTPVTMDYIYLLLKIMKEHRGIMVEIDVIYVKNTTFVVSTYRGIRFNTA